MVALGRLLVAGSLTAVIAIPCARSFAQAPQYSAPQYGAPQYGAAQSSYPQNLPPASGPALPAAPNSAPPATSAISQQVPPTEKIHGVSSVLPPGGFPDVATPMLTPTEPAAASAVAGGTVVKEVRVEGNHTTPVSKMPKLRTRAGEPYDPQTVKDDVRALASSRKFLDVKPQLQAVPGGMVVIFQVVERPTLEYVYFVGNQDVRTQTLRKKSELEVKQPLDPYAVEEGRRRVEAYYREKGYNHITITTIEGNKPNDHGAVFLVDEGKSERVLWTGFEGNTVLGDARERYYVKTKPGFLWLFGGKVDRKKIEEDEQALLALYRGMGFFKAKIGHDLEYNEEGTWLSLKFIIDEGPRYSIRNVAFMGNEKFKVDELNKNLEQVNGKPFSQTSLDHDLAGIRDVYGAHGYVFADVQAETVLAEDKPEMDLKYMISEGKQYRVGQININITGDQPHTRHSVILNRMALRPGDILNTKKLREDERRLKFASVFNADPTKGGGAPKITFSKPAGEKDEQLAGRDSSTSSTPSSRPNPSPTSSSGYGGGSPSSYGGAYGGSNYRGQSPDDDVVLVDVSEAEDSDGNSYVVFTPAQPPQAQRAAAAKNVQGNDLSRARFQSPGSNWQDYPSTPSAMAARNAWDGYTSGGSSYLPGSAQPMPATNATNPYSPGYSGSSISAPPIGGSPMNASPIAAQGVRQIPAAAQVAPNPMYSGTAYPGGSVPAQSSNFQVAQNAPAAGDSFSPTPPPGTPIYQPPGQAPAYTYQQAPPPGYASGPPPGYLSAPPAQPYNSPPSYAPGSAIYGQGVDGSPPVDALGRPIGQSRPAPAALPPDVAIPSLVEPDQPLLPIDITAGETTTGRLMIGVGVNSDAGLVGQFVLDEQNFDITRLPHSWEDVADGTAWRGAGQRFRIEANPGTLVQRYAATFQEPYLFEVPGGGWVAFDVSGFYFTRIYQDWDEARVGGTTHLGYMFTPDLTGRIGFDGERVTIFDPHKPTPQILQEAVGQNDRYGFSVGLAHDTRDSPFLPTQGHLLSWNFEEVVGTFIYPHTEIEARQYFKLRERADGSGRHVLAIGTLVGFAGENTPIYDNYFAGGFSTLRGFAFRGASPLEENVQVGGRFEFLNTAEYMFPITADDALRGVVFCDFGTVERDVAIHADQFRAAPGFGLRISIPAMGPAPIALDLAFPVALAKGDQVQNFSFFVGIAR
jgi:outer membrane protein insertion porin family